jgi:hypothetical protein
MEDFKEGVNAFLNHRRAEWPSRKNQVGESTHS